MAIDRGLAIAHSVYMTYQKEPGPKQAPMHTTKLKPACMHASASSPRPHTTPPSTHLWTALCPGVGGTRARARVPPCTVGLVVGPTQRAPAAGVVQQQQVQVRGAEVQQGLKCIAFKVVLATCNITSPPALAPFCQWKIMPRYLYLSNCCTRGTLIEPFPAPK